jgi:hypothetical protein
VGAIVIDKLKLLMGRPILVNKKSNIYVHQPLISDVVDMGEDEYNNLVLPYTLTTDTVFNGAEKEDELKEQYHLFDLFFIELEDGKTLLDNIFGGRNAIEALSDSLRYFLRVDDVKVLKKRKKLIIDNSYMIDKVEFDNLRKVIQGVVNRTDIEVEKPPKNMTKRQKDIWMKLQKGRKRTAEKNAIYLQDMINYISFGGKSFIPLDQIDRMTYYQMQNAYKSVIGRDTFDVSMGYKLSQKFDVKDEVKHWTDALKIGK